MIGCALACVAVLIIGVPLDRTTILAVVVGVVVVSTRRRCRAGLADVVRQWGVLAVLLLLYDLTRGVGDSGLVPVRWGYPATVDRAVFGRLPSAWLQQRLGPFEGAASWWEVPVSLIYVSHFGVPIVVGGWLWTRHQPRWAGWRDGVVALSLIGLICYVAVPTAPPWLAARSGRIEQVGRVAHRGWARLGVDIAPRIVDFGAAATNPVAAMPSLHAAFALFSTLAVWTVVRRCWRFVWLAYALAMGFVLVLTAEHYVVDVAAGYAAAGSAVLAARWWRRVGLTHAESVTRRLSRAWSLVAARCRVRFLVVGAMAATMLVRSYRLGWPRVFVFDEVFYATQAYEIARYGVEVGWTAHPPGAKWLIAGGVRLLGFTPWGWRLAALMAGSLVVGGAVAASYVLTHSRRLAALAGLLVLTDGIATISGRLALLDTFCAAAATIAFVGALILVDGRAPPARWRCLPWLIGVSFGVALATKWSALPVWAVTVVSAVVAAHRRGAPWHRVLSVLVCVPVAVYASAYVPTLLRYRDSAIARRACAEAGWCGSGMLDRVAAIAREQLVMLRFHRDLVPTNRYVQHGWTWFTQTRPVTLYGDRGHLLSTQSNRVIWIAFAAVLLAGTARVVARRGTAAETLAVLTALAWVLPWIAVGRKGYAFYAAPIVPVLAVILCSFVWRLTPPTRSTATWAVSLTALAGFVMLRGNWFG